MYDDVIIKGKSAYARGIDAAYRIGEYEGYKTIPECPYKEGTKEDAWWKGFGDGTEDLIYLQGV